MSRDILKKDISVITTYQSGIAQASAHRLTNRIVTDFLLIYNLTPMQWFTLGIIFDASPKGIRLSDLAEVLDTTLPYITNNTAMLEAKGLIRKVVHRSDARIKLVTINPTELSMFNEIEQKLRERLRQELYVENDISRDELSSYIGVIFKLIAK